MNSHFAINCLCVTPAEDAPLEEIIQYAILHMKTEPVVTEEPVEVDVSLNAQRCQVCWRKFLSCICK